MNDIDPLKQALMQHAPEIAGAVVAVVGAAAAWLVAWVRSHMAASAVRQALRAHGDTATALNDAMTEMMRVPALLRPRNASAAVNAELDKQRLVRRPQA